MASWPLLAKANPLITVFQVNTFFSFMLQNTLKPSSTLPHLAYMSTNAVPNTTSNSQASLFTAPNDARKVHVLEDEQGIVVAPNVVVPGDQHAPGDNIPARHFVEQASA
ncbi:hypothetical protein CR513_51912, partial [Mucuna pruriens]